MKDNDKLFVNNLKDIISKNKDYMLTTKGFNEISEISVMRYTTYWRKNWYDILKEFNVYDRLCSYIKDEFVNYHNTTGSSSFQDFVYQHKYVTQDFGKYYGSKNFKKYCGFEKRKYTYDDLKNNFFNVLDRVGHIPNYTEFKKNSNIIVDIYHNYYKTKQWESIIRIYIEDIELLKQHEETQKINKSKIASISAQKEYLYSNDELEEELKRVFNHYFENYNSYPSRRLFNKVSKFNDFLYRKRFNKTWVEICGVYGFVITKDNHKTETICLNIISIILDSNYKQQKTWNWLRNEKNYNLYCDGYFEDFNIVIEIDGAHHRIPVVNYGGYERFIKQKRNDETKESKLKEHDIKLIRISTKEKWYDEEYLRQKLTTEGLLTTNGITQEAS